MCNILVLGTVHAVSLETLDMIAKGWALEIEHHLMTGFPSRVAALDYYRQYVLKTNPMSVRLMFSFVGIASDFQFAYTII